MTDIQEQLFLLQDKEYAVFQGNLSPGVDKTTIIGVRVPLIKKLAKDLLKQEKVNDFLKELPHRYYDENMLHSAILSNIKKFGYCLENVDRFLPFIDNWAVCDTLRPKALLNNREVFLTKIREWIKSDKEYTCRFGTEMLMTYYLDDNYDSKFLKYPAKIKSDKYYVSMMTAWFYATALAKHWDDAVLYLTENKLSPWVHNKTIQKATESFRITKEQKEYLLKLKRE